MLGGWVQGDGPPVLLLRGGPGLGFEYLEGLADELAEGWAVAAYQQRGLPPSSTAGPYAVADHVADARRVLDALGWDRAVVVGHSWGGHLALHVAAALPERTAAVLAVDPLGAVGDSGRPSSRRRSGHAPRRGRARGHRSSTSGRCAARRPRRTQSRA